MVCLKESALCSRLTIAELSELIIALAGGDPRAEKPRVEVEDKYELIRSLLKHHQKPLKLCFPDEEIRFQLPLIPKFQADPIERIVEAKIISLTSLSAKIRVLDDAVLAEKKQSDQFRHGRNRTEFRLLRPGRADKVLLGQQLQFAMDTDTRLTMQVRIAREVVTGQVSHLELCAILNAGDVRDGLSY